MQKLKSFAAQDLKVMQGDGEDPDSEGDQVPMGSPGQKDLLVNMGQWDLQDPSALKVISEYRGPWSHGS